jgi:predicted RNA binding protein YcfA (HicA-like mRNA interferase family)
MSVSRISPLKAKKIVATLIKLGFYIHHQKGSHIQLRHSERRRIRVTIARHDKFDLPSFVVKSILKQAEVLEDDFLNRL